MGSELYLKGHEGGGESTEMFSGVVEGKRMTCRPLLMRGAIYLDIWSIR